MNILEATIHSSQSSKHISIITVMVHDDFLDLFVVQEHFLEPVGAKISLAFKETEVILAKTTSETTANINRALIKEIKQGQILTEISLTYHDATINTLVQNAKFEKLGLCRGDRVYWIVNPAEISLLRSRGEQ
jgi:molybdopterin-binding protein